MEATGDFWICVTASDNQKEYSYIADILLSEEEASSTMEVDTTGLEYEKIKICKKSYTLAQLRFYPDDEEEIHEIINYSRGIRIKLTIWERIILFLRT